MTGGSETRRLVGYQPSSAMWAAAPAYGRDSRTCRCRCKGARRQCLKGAHPNPQWCPADCANRPARADSVTSTGAVCSRRGTWERVAVELGDSGWSVRGRLDAGPGVPGGRAAWSGWGGAGAGLSGVVRGSRCAVETLGHSQMLVPIKL